MMKVTAFIGSARKKHTFKATERFMENLRRFGNVDYELIVLSDYNLGICRGCKLCIDKGEELCPIKDDRDILMKKIKESDGILFATPNYSFQVSGMMKVFLDRFGYLFHRPEYFGKTCTSIVAQGIYGGKKIVSYLDFAGSSLGFNVVRGQVIKTLEPMREKEMEITAAAIDKHSRRYYKQLVKQEFPVPSFIKLLLFRMSRTSMKVMLNDSFRDYRFYNEKGWFGSDYYYPVSLNPVKKMLGRLFDYSASRMAARN